MTIPMSTDSEDGSSFIIVVAQPGFNRQCFCGWAIPNPFPYRSFISTAVTISFTKGNELERQGNEGMIINHSPFIHLSFTIQPQKFLGYNRMNGEPTDDRETIVHPSLLRSHTFSIHPMSEAWTCACTSECWAIVSQHQHQSQLHVWDWLLMVGRNVRWCLGHNRSNVDPASLTHRGIYLLLLSSYEWAITRANARVTASFIIDSHIPTSIRALTKGLGIGNDSKKLEQLLREYVQRFQLPGINLDSMLDDHTIEFMWMRMCVIPAFLVSSFLSSHSWNLWTVSKRLHEWMKGWDWWSCNLCWVGAWRSRMNRQRSTHARTTSWLLQPLPKIHSLTNEIWVNG